MLCGETKRFLNSEGGKVKGVFKRDISKFSTNSPSKGGVGGQIEELSLNQRELSLKMGRGLCDDCEARCWRFIQIHRLSFEVVC